MGCKIIQMVTAPYSQTLNLLREVACTRVCNKRREESQGILKETKCKRDKINWIFKTINDRRATLEKEKGKLKDYQKYDKMRRVLKYRTHNRDLQMAGKKAKSNYTEVTDMNIKEGSAMEEWDTISSELQDYTKETTKLEFLLKDLRDKVGGDNNSKKKAKHELNKMITAIKKKEKEWKTIKLSYMKMGKKEGECTKDFTLKEQKIKKLYTKHGRGSHFTSNA